MRRRWTYAGKVLLAAMVTGAFCVGVLSRLAMFVLAELNPAADGVISDDGFEMGRFTLSGSLNLVLFGATAIAFVGWLAYLAARPLLVGPAWCQWLSLSVPPGVVGGALAVHTDGVDFGLLEPTWLAIGLFVLVPASFGPILHLLVLRYVDPEPRDGWAARHAVPAWALRAGFAAVAVVALVDLTSDIRTLV